MVSMIKKEQDNGQQKMDETKKKNTIFIVGSLCSILVYGLHRIGII